MNGIIIINKPAGITSQQVVSKIKKTLNIKKAGHTGTLDPLATGVLPILLEDCTKISKYLIEHDKKYIAEIKFGEKRDTGDLEGKIIETSDKKIENKDKVKKVLEKFIGKQFQIPPKYSAIKINGKKLYEYARNNEEVEIPKREIEIYRLEMLEFNVVNQILKIEIYCSKGTYIRTLCENISEKLGICGYMYSLKRTEVDKFKIDEAVSLDELEENKNDQKFLSNNILSMEKVFENLPKINLDNKRKKLFFNGVKLKVNLDDGLYNIYSEKYLGLGIIKNRRFKKRCCNNLK